ncbi:hypothetical protein BU813_22800 [Klebsiella pneumoniae subsp. pneumoniae]|nr:hypothetical protein [Klebsiella pneumoniae]ASG34887.1 hypothetical protein CES89_16335 [Klebsiella pneumoniae]AUX50120.1 hypothetical protein BU195_05250 [Klebsiella pneumoniae subsp. pneumoniae]AUX58791.1 hypothetical protein BU813_22800 [Klebsiella pneumoniae subsp. pneumoniae]AZV14715.1 hypothetical protein EMI85_12390 [Klebsiella pneumoniae]EIV5862671.1 hypothetical protein [Klebsiella pneumoniae]
MIKNQQPCPIVDENERSLRFEYRFRRYGIIVLSLIILTALSGLWSSGYFSEAHRETSGGELSVDYQRYARLMSETELNIQIKSDTASYTIISFAAPLLTRYQIGDIRPQPDKMYSTDGKLHLVYQRSNPPSPISVWLAVTPKTAGNISLQAVVNDRYSVTWQQFVYP